MIQYKFMIKNSGIKHQFNLLKCNQINCQTKYCITYLLLEFKHRRKTVIFLQSFKNSNITIIMIGKVLSYPTFGLLI